MFPPQFIVAERVGVNLEIGSKKRLLEVLGELLASGSSVLSPEAVFEHLLERERLGSTGLGHGIALPHARMKEIESPLGAFARLREGVEFDSIDERPVDLAFALLVPQSANELHLQLLSGLAAKLSDPRLRESLRGSASAEEIVQLLAGEGLDSPPS